MMKLDNCNALITGASAGIGREFARQLASRARSMILVARRDERLIELADQLQREHPKLLVHIRKVDLADLGQLQAFLERLDREKLEVDLLINNAGLGDSGPFAESDLDRNKEMTVVNVETLTLITRHFVPRMIAQHRGAILNVSSSAGFLPIPGSAVYAATKAYVTSFSEALRAELRESGVSVCALCPGPVVTEFQQVAKRGGARPDIGPTFLVVTVEQVVRDALAALEADRPLVVPGFAMFVCRYVVSARAPGRQTRARMASAQRQNCQRDGQFATAASMQTAAKVVSGRKYQICVGIFAIRKKTKKPINPAVKAVPPKQAAVFAACSGTSGRTRIVFTQRAIATITSAIHSQRNQTTVGAIAADRLVQIRAG